MRTIEYKTLYNYLTEEEHLSIIATLRNILRIRKMDKEIRLALFEYLKGNEPDIVIEDVSFKELQEDEELTPIQAFLFLDWVKREPLEAIEFMKSEKNRMSLQPMKEKQLTELQKAMEELKKDGVEIKEEEPLQEDTSDIEID